MNRLRSMAGLMLAAALLWPHGAATQPQSERSFAQLARGAGMPQVPGLRIVYLAPLGNPAAAPWKNIIVHQTEGPAGSARALAERQAKNPSARGVTLWVETDGTVYWATPETVVTTHGDGANRNDNKYIDNSQTHRKVIQTNSIGIEFVGNYPDVRKPATPEQTAAWLVLVRFLQERYGIASERVYAHNWIDYKDKRYCEGCELADKARALRYVPGGDKPTPAAATATPAEPDKDYIECAARLAPLAVFTPLPAVTEPAECAVSGLLRLEAVLMGDRSRVALQPPATLRCAMAEAVVQFVRSEIGPAAAELGSPLAAITTADSYGCRGRNRQPGTKLSEHGRANALDIAALRLADRSTVSLTSQTVSQDFRGRVRDAACRFFTTVLGPGSDAYHNDHIHLDRAERSRGYRICQWDLQPPAPPVAAAIPLPRPKPVALTVPASKPAERRPRQNKTAPN